MTAANVRFASLRALGGALLGMLAWLALTAPPASADFQQAGRWIVYPDGRVFDPHGLNSFATFSPYYPALLGRDDARLLADEGFTSIRTGFQPHVLEPQKGQFNLQYLDHFHKLAGLLQGYGIATYLTFTQDGYGPACGGDGLPLWMSPVKCGSLWQVFFSSAGAWLRGATMNMWRVVSQQFKNQRAVIGYDLLNEPGNWDYDIPSDSAVARLMADIAGVVRGPNEQRPAFAEPSIADDAVTTGLPQRIGAFVSSLPSGSSFTSHLYCNLGTSGAPTTLAGCIAADKRSLTAIANASARSRSAYLLGEFGAGEDLSEETAVVDRADQHFLPWTEYEYLTSYDYADGVTTSPASLLRDENQPASEANANQVKLDALVVPYPMATAGTPLRWSFSRATDRVRFVYSTDRAGGGRFGLHTPTVVFIPKRKYPRGYAVHVHGATVVSRPGWPWLKLQTRPGARRVVANIRPTEHGRTLNPLQVNQCGYDLRPCGR
jgi:endoglycosylceramidase